MKIRQIPLTTKICVIFARSTTLWGWLAFSLILIVTRVAIIDADTTFIHFIGKDTEQTQATIVKVVDTHQTSNDLPVYANVYEFFDDQGIVHQKDAFTTGSARKIGDVINIEYPIGQPGHARATSLLNAEQPAWVLVFLVFPLMGLAMIIQGIWEGFKDYQLLTIGKTTHAWFINKLAAHSGEGQSAQYIMRYDFKDEQGQLHHAKLRTHKPDDFELKELTVFYDPNNPDKASLMEGMAGELYIDRHQQVLAKIGWLIAAIVMPSISIAPHFFF